MVFIHLEFIFLKNLLIIFTHYHLIYFVVNIDFFYLVCVSITFNRIPNFQELFADR